jgi:hypothetical protein
MRVHKDWNNPPDYHKECEWYEKTCEICHSSMKVHRAWSNVPRSHKECLAKYAPKDVSCSQCGKSFTISMGLQLKCHEQGWKLPERCEECKHDALLIKGAVGALRDQFPFALETTIEQRGFIFTDKVAVVRSKKTGEVVAEVKMDNEGLIFVDRVAVAVDKRSGKTLSKTKEGSEGFFFPQRTADSYDSRSGKRTHRTKMVERGIFFPKHVAETRNVSDGTAPKSTTRVREKGLIFPKQVTETDKEK